MAFLDIESARAGLAALPALAVRAVSGRYFVYGPTAGAGAVKG